MLNNIPKMWINSHTNTLFSTSNQINRGWGVWSNHPILGIPHVKIPNINVEKIKSGTLN